MSNRSVQRVGRLMGLAIVALCLASAAPSARGAFHLWQLHEVFSNADGSVQFIEMFDTSSFEYFTNGQTLTANSDGNIKTFTLTDLAGDAPGSLLFATPAFAPLPGAVTPDFTFAGGNFFNPNAANITLTFSGSNDSITFSGASLPKNGLNSLTDANVYAAQNLISGVNSPTNLGGSSGSINVSPEPGTGLFLTLPLIGFLRRRRTHG